MARVICRLEHASTKINGVTFTADRGEMISEEISDEVAASFTAIPGYTLVGAKVAKPAEPPAAPPPPPPVEPDPPPPEQPPAPPPPPPPPPEQAKATTGKKA